MYVPTDRLTWLQMLMKLRGSVLPRILGRMGVVTGVALVNTTLRLTLHYDQLSLTPTPFVLLGLPLGIFLGFKNQASYERYWEGRKLWGALVNTCRTFARQTMTLIAPRGPDDAGEVRRLHDELVRRAIAYAWALRFHLRDEKDDGTARGFLPADERARFDGERNAPIAMIHRLGERVADAHRAGWLRPEHVLPLDASLTSLCDVQGACERIKSTPVPFSYNVLIHRLVAIYCFLLPFGLVEAIGWMTPLVVLFLSYAFFGLDQIGDEIEDPFGTDVNDLPLASIARTIEINLRQRLGDDPLPEPLRPVDGFLL